MHRHLKKIGNAECISSWKFKGLSDENIKPPATSDTSLAPALTYIGSKTRAKFDRGYLKHAKITFNHGTIVNIYIVYVTFSHSNNNDPILENYLLGAVNSLKILILIIINVVDMVLDLKNVELFHFLVVDLVSM